MTNKEGLYEALVEMIEIHSDKPVIVELSKRMMESEDSTVDILTFISTLCNHYPFVLEELNNMAMIRTSNANHQTRNN